MSLDLSVIEIEQFLSDAHAEFQSQGFLLERAVRVKSGTKGQVVHFPVFGQGLANQKAPQDEVVPMNVGNKDKEATLQVWYAPEYADRSFKNKLAVNAVDEYAQICAYAIGRRCDQIIIDTMETGVTYNTSPTADQGADIAAGGAAFTFDKLLEGHKFLRKRSANMGERFVIINAEAEEALLNATELTSSDFVNRKALESDGLNGMTIMGMNFIVVPDMDEGGIAAGESYIINKMALGVAMNERLGGDISWENSKASYLINMWHEAGAVAIDPKGFVRINYV